MANGTSNFFKRGFKTKANTNCEVGKCKFLGNDATVIKHGEYMDIHYSRKFSGSGSNEE